MIDVVGTKISNAHFRAPKHYTRDCLGFKGQCLEFRPDSVRIFPRKIAYSWLMLLIYVIPDK